MKKFFGEFKTFIMRGNVMELAVGIIIGGAFTAIVNALVNNLIMPFVSLLTGGNFNDLFLILKLPEGVEASQVTFDNASELGVTIWGYGAFITAVINFLIVALVIFLIVKAINKVAEKAKKKEEEVEEEPTTKKCPHCCEEVNINATKCPHCTGDIPAED